MKHLGILVFLLSILSLSYQSESVHAQPETHPYSCHKLNDIIDDDGDTDWGGFFW